jgi:hypothetical protein
MKRWSTESEDAVIYRLASHLQAMKNSYIGALVPQPKLIKLKHLLLQTRCKVKEQYSIRRNLGVKREITSKPL